MAIHGGNLDSAVRRYGLQRDKIKDFSANINPLGLPEKAKKAIIENLDMASTYPDADYLALRMAISNYVNVRISNVIVGNGSTELLSLFIRNFADNTVIVAPAYSEYEREVKLAGGICRYFSLKEEASFNIDIEGLCRLLTNETSLLIICNPNNPTGTAIKIENMDAIAEVCRQKEIQLLIDETYAEFSDESKYSSVRLVNKFDNIMVVRGVAKFFSAPGFRLGYGICSEANAKLLNDDKEPWSVNIFAAIAGESFFADSEYILNTKRFIAEERKRVFDSLSKWSSIKVYESQSNFLLFKLLKGDIKSADIFEKLIQKGIMIRNAESFLFLNSSYIRFCLLNKEDNTLLLNELWGLLQ